LETVACDVVTVDSCVLENRNIVSAVKGYLNANRTDVNQKGLSSYVL